MTFIDEVNESITSYRKEYKEAGPGYSNWSQTLRKKIAGKVQVRSNFLDELQEFRCQAKGLGETKAIVLIDAMLKAYV